MNNKVVIIMTLIVITAASILVSTNINSNAFAQSKSGGLCEEGHKCICTSNGVFHDLTTGISINNGCRPEDL